MSRRGRTRKQGSRKPSGRLRMEIDTGTIELRAHRAVALDPTLAIMPPELAAEHATGEGKTRRIVSGDRRAAYALGIMHAQGVITGAQHYAGKRYTALYNRGVRRVGIPSAIGQMMGRAGSGSVLVAEGTPEGARAEYIAAKEALLKVGRLIALCTERVAVFDAIPAGVDERALLRVGLNALWRHFEQSDRERVA